MKKIYPSKDPDEILKYGFNWTPRNIGTERIILASTQVLGGGVTVLSSAVADVPNARDGQGTVHTVSGGTDGQTAEIKLHIETDAGSVLEQTVYIPIRQK